MSDKSDIDALAKLLHACDKLRGPRVIWEAYRGDAEAILALLTSRGWSKKKP